jgi:hypothetical protein
MNTPIQDLLKKFSDDNAEAFFKKEQADAAKEGAPGPHLDCEQYIKAMREALAANNELTDANVEVITAALGVLQSTLNASEHAAGADDKAFVDDALRAAKVDTGTGTSINLFNETKLNEKIAAAVPAVPAAPPANAPPPTPAGDTREVIRKFTKDDQVIGFTLAAPSDDARVVVESVDEGTPFARAPAPAPAEDGDKGDKLSVGDTITSIKIGDAVATENDAILTAITGFKPTVTEQTITLVVKRNTN